MGQGEKEALHPGCTYIQVHLRRWPRKEQIAARCVPLLVRLGQKSSSYLLGEESASLSKYLCSLLIYKCRESYCLLPDPSGSVQVGGMGGRREDGRRKDSIHPVVLTVNA